MIAHRIIAALRLSPLTVPQLRKMLNAHDRSIRYAMDELASRGMVRPLSRFEKARDVIGRLGQPTRVWELAA